MDVYEITGNTTGLDKSGVNILLPGDSYQKLENGYVYRQVLQSRRGISLFAPRLDDETRVYGIFNFITPDGSKECLVADANFLYKFNETTGVFDQLAFGGSMAAYAGFGLTAREDYVSGTAYPVSDNSLRFVFTGRGLTPNANGSAVFFYDGTEVLDYTDVGDNPDYSPPPQGALIRSTHVIQFNQRLNFVVPIIASVQYSQGVLYSGIRDASGNGDKFDVAGSGLLELDTQDVIRGARILGQVLLLRATASDWALEKTRDAFNPYFQRQIPTEIGTSASFSPVSWQGTNKSLGITGAITTDSRATERFDNKIPDFTNDEIDGENFEMTYGGFDRINGQFLWSYKKSGSESETQDGVLVYNYEEGSWATYNMRLSCFGETDLGINLSWDDIDETNNPSWATWDTTEELWDKIGLGKSVQKTLAGDDLGFVYDINVDYDDYFTNITGITQANQAVITVEPSSFEVGDLVTISSVTGMAEINNFDPAEDNKNYVPYTVLAATDVSVTINYDSSTAPAYISGGTLSKVISFYAETIPFNPYRKDGDRVYISHVDLLMQNTGALPRVSVFADQQSTPFIQDTLCQIPTDSSGSSVIVSMSVNNESEFMTFAIKNQSPASQFRLESLKLYCERGGKING